MCFLCVWDDYSSNDNSTYGGWINLPEHWDHKSNLRMIILLPDEELIPNVMQWSEREDVFVMVWYGGEACLPIADKNRTAGWICLFPQFQIYQITYYSIYFKLLSINKCILFFWLNSYIIMCLYSSCNVCIWERVVFFSFSFFYCVKSPCTNPTVLLLSSGPWKWTGCKTCRVHISQISTETPPQTLSPYSNSYLYLCSAQ